MNKKTMFKNFLKWITFVLCGLPLSAAAQVLNTPTAESPVHFANTTDFSAGTLTVSFQLGGGQNTAEVEITLPQGIEYAGEVTPSSGATAVLKTGSTPSKPIFNVTAAAGSNVTLAVKRKVVAAVMSNTNALGNGFEDSVVLTVNGNRSAAKKNAVPYQLPHPTLTVQQPEGTQNNAAGTHNKEYEIQNTGNGIVRDVYFSIAYPPGVTGNSVAYKIGSGTYTTLTQVGTVPTGSPNAGKPLYKVPAVHLANGQSVKIRENYTVTGCTSGRQIIYYAYWGVAPNNLFKNSPIASKTINVDSGKPLIDLDRGNSNNTYFTWGDGLSGNKLGTFTVRYHNIGTGSNPTASKIKIKLFERHTGTFRSHKPTNFRLVYTDGAVEKEIPIPATAISQPVANQAITISFDNMPELLATHATYGGKNIGFTDEDGDGYRDELKKNAGFTLRFDYVKNNGITCLSSGFKEFLINPSSEMYCEGICGNSGDNGGAYLHEQTFERFVNGVSDGSYFPRQLVENVSKTGYLIASFNVSGYTHKQRLKGQAAVENPRLYKYKIKLPAGIELKNVQFYKGFKYGTSTQPPIPLGNVPAGGELTYTTTTTAYGYLTFDIVLKSCSGTNATVDYSVSYLDKNGATNTYSEIPYVCTSTTINTVCITPCSVDGPTMLSTKVERADNSYGWKDHTMAVRQTRDQVSELQRQRALYLDDIEVISTGKELNVLTHNLYYHASFKKAPGLKPKSIVFTMGTHSATLAGTTAVKTTVGDKDYFRWNLTSALPTGGIPPNGTFTVVATYQVMNNSDTDRNNSYDIESGGENFFYRLENPATDTALNAQGYHTAQKHCGVNLYATFFYANLWNHLNTNTYYVDGCATASVGLSNQVFAGRRFNSGGNYFLDEFRPSRLIKKLTFKIPSSMNYVANPTYVYRQKYTTESSPIPFVLTLVSDDGTYKTYTYVNPGKGQTGHLPAGEISVENLYDSYIKTYIQATCKTKVYDNFANSKANNMLVKSEIEYEDFYYHYAAQGGSVVKTYAMPEGQTAVYHRYKPDVAITSLTPLTVKVNKREQDLRFSLANSTQSDAPYSWVSIPDVTGVEILSLTEIASGGAHVRTYTAQTSISGEKMFFLNEGGAPGTIVKNGIRYFKVNYKITNCNANYALKVYAGWNCNGNPTSGYKSTCSDKFLTYNISIAQTKKEIIADPTNPGESNANKVGTISMCAKTPYSYTINSANEGDLYDAKLVVTQAAGITFHDIEVEYPLGSGIKYNTNTLVNGKKIGHTVVGSKHTFDISAILPGGSLPGSESEKTIAANRQLKLTFKVMPDCDFAAGSSFDIDIEGNDLCGNPASGDKSRAIIAGIAGVNVNRYSINLDPLTYVSGNGTQCDSGVVYKTRVTVSSSDPTFAMGANARLRFTIPEGYELAPSYLNSLTRTPYGPGALWSNPARKQTEERTLASGSELVLDIPAGMKSGQFFELGIKIVQKANTLIDCATPKTLKAFATDTVTGVTCSLLPPPSTCPALTVGTSLERTVQVKNDRPELSFKDISTSSVIQGGKEKLTIKYKLTNAATASATLTARSVVASLYYDANNNGRVDSGDTKLTTYTTTETLGQGGTSPEISFDYLADQNKACRLLLVLKNEDNICLCGDVATKVTAPTELTGLVNSLTTCATDSVTFQYSAQAPAYAGYEWKAVTPSNALGYLNNTNTPTPTFAYTGAPLSSALTVTYNLVVKRTNGCEATQTVTVLVKAVPAPVLTVSPTLVVSCKAANATTTINNWLQQAATATASAPCATIASLTHNYDSVKPTNLCEATVVTVTYTAKDNYGNITTKTTTITVVSIEANNDTVTVSHGATATTTTQTVLTNDKANTRTATTSTVSLTVTTPAVGVTGSATPTLNTNGTITVPAGTKSGTYQIGYRICTTVSAVTACDTATATVVVGAPAVIANNDTATVTNGITGGTVSSVLTNDSYNGVTNPSTNSVTLSWGALPAGVVTTTNIGELKVNAGTASGTHQIPYTICDKVNTHNCSTATLTLVIGAPAVTPTITVGGDSYTVTGTITTPTTVGNILTNDSLGGQTPTVASVTIHTATPTSATTPRIDPSTGNVVIPSGTPSGTYTMSYYLCERANSSNCSTLTTVTVTVVGVSTPTVTPTITVGGDSYTVTGTITTPTTVGNILTNDSLGGQTPTVASVTIHTATPTSATTPRIDPSTGNVVIPSGTPSGTYTMSYYLCERANSSNCSSPTTVTVTVVGVSSPTVTPTTIEANGDTFVQNGVPTSTTTLGNILTNDKLNGNLNPAVQSVTITTPSTPAHTPYIHPGTGEVIVPPHTPVGVYELPYTICALASPTVCDTATAVVTVNSIEAHNDGRHLLGTTVGGTISNVLANDKLNGHTPAASEVTINWQATPAGFTYNADGSITVAAGTAVGTYTISYTLCATATPTLCSEPAEVVVEVTAATPVPPLSITAVYDGVYYIEKGTATALTSVLANDLLDSDPATTGNVSLTWDISAPAGFTLNADGTVHVATDTAVGRYKIPYTICAKNGMLCSTTELVVTVLAPTVTPTIEVNGETFTYTGNPTVGNVLTNEKLNGTPNPSVRSVTISIMPPPPGAYEPYLDPSTGDVIVPPHTPAGNYTVTYRVCTIDTPVACGVAQVTVVIPATPTSTVVPVAADDKVETARNTPVTINVLANDTPNGATTPNVVTAPLNGTAVVNPDGTIEYTPNTGFVGTDRLVYTLCNAGGCATATVNIEVTNKLIAYNGVSVNGSDKNNHFHIAGIEAYPDNTVRIYNRWGVKVWETQSYDNVRNVFKGISNGRVTVEAADKLPQGTYYYIIEYVDENNQKQTMVGWLYLKK